MKLKLNKQDLEGQFMNTRDCPIARTLKRRGFNVYSVGVTGLTIGNKRYPLSIAVSNDILDAQRRNLKSLTIEIEGLESLSFKQRIINFFK